MASCTLHIGTRRVLVSDEGPPAAEFALFDSSDVELSQTEAGALQESGYRTTAAEAASRLSYAGITQEVADECAAFLRGRMAEAYARGPIVRRLAALLGPAELFEGGTYDATRRHYEGAWLDLPALANDAGIPRATGVLHALSLISLLHEVPRDTAVVLSTGSTDSLRLGERTLRRNAIAGIESVPRALLQLSAHVPAPHHTTDGPARDVIEARLRSRLETCEGEETREHVFRLGRMLNERPRPAQGPLSDPELWEIDRLLAQGNAPAAVVRLDLREARAGREPGTIYLRARAALLLGTEAPRTIAQRVGELALSMANFPDVELLAAQAWNAAGEMRIALPFARDLISNPKVHDELRIAAESVLRSPRAPASSSEDVGDRDFEADGDGDLVRASRPLPAAMRAPSRPAPSEGTPLAPRTSVAPPPAQRASLLPPARPSAPAPARGSVAPTARASVVPPVRLTVPPPPGAVARTSINPPPVDGVPGARRTQAPLSPLDLPRAASERPPSAMARSVPAPVGASATGSLRPRDPRAESEPPPRPRSLTPPEIPKAPAAPPEMRRFLTPPERIASPLPPRTSRGSIPPPAFPEMKWTPPDRPARISDVPPGTRPSARIIDGVSPWPSSMRAPREENTRPEEIEHTPAAPRATSPRYMRGASMPPLASEPPRMVPTPRPSVIPRVDIDEPDLIETLPLPRGGSEVGIDTSIAPRTSLEARIRFTLESRELARRYRHDHGVELRLDNRAVSSMQRHLTERFPSRLVNTPEEAREAELHGALLSELLSRLLDAEWADITPTELGYWAMSVPTHDGAGKRVWPFGRVLRFIASGGEDDLVAFFRKLRELT